MQTEILYADFLATSKESSSCLQSLVVSILAGSGVLSTTEDQKNLANFLICAEMLPAAIGMLFAFPYHEYKGTAHDQYASPNVILRHDCTSAKCLSLQ